MRQNVELALTAEQFEVFIMVYASFADFEESTLERSFIINKFGERRYREALEIYSTMSEYLRVQLIVHHLDVFKNPEKKKEILSSLKTLLDFDGLNRFEETFYNYLNRVIKHVN